MYRTAGKGPSRRCGGMSWRLLQAGRLQADCTHSLVDTARVSPAGTRCVRDLNLGDHWVSLRGGKPDPYPVSPSKALLRSPAPCLRLANEPMTRLDDLASKRLPLSGKIAHGPAPVGGI